VGGFGGLDEGLERYVFDNSTETREETAASVEDRLQNGTAYRSGVRGVTDPDAAPFQGVPWRRHARKNRDLRSAMGGNPAL
jgi:hypothetical protein